MLVKGATGGWLVVSHCWRHSKPKFCPFLYHFHNICINRLLKLCIMDATWIFILLQGCSPPWEQPTVLGLSLANRTLLLAIGNGKSGRLKQDSMIFLAQFCLGIPMSVENCCMEWGSYAWNIPQCHCPASIATLVQRWPNVNPYVGPTSAHQRWANVDLSIGPTLAQRLHANVGPTLCQHRPNVGTLTLAH